MKRNILFVAMCLPYDKASHAGGKTFNYYIKQYANDINNEITLISKVLPEEENYVETFDKNIKVYTVSTPKNKIKKVVSYMKSLNSKFNPYYRYGNVLTKDIYDQIFAKLKKLKTDGYKPDIIILEWTAMLLFIQKVKKIYPNAKYVASEHDVTFLGLERRYKNEFNPLKKRIEYIKYNTIKYYELQSIKDCDFVVTHNEKDKNLLVKNGIDKTKVGTIVPYFDKFFVNKRNPKKGNIIFYGAMNRLENYSAALWFIDNVIPKLKNYNIHFTVIGNRPPKELRDKQCNNIEITGFVDDPTQYFEDAMCLVAPLFLGAGVKVKVIEALSSGVPVVTNEIGIEGIEAKDKIDYFLANTADEYAGIIIGMLDGKLDTDAISHNARNLIEDNYDLSKSFRIYSEAVYRLME